MKKKYFYVVHIQYLGYRFHGWAKQKDLKTVHFMIDKTLTFALGHSNFKTIGGSRTDSKVSALESAFELFLEEELPSNFLSNFNSNLPPDIRALSVEEVDAEFNMIQSPKSKIYHYLFCFGEKTHPFCAPLMNSIPEDLNIELMEEGAKLLKGQHNFKQFCTKPSANSTLERELLESKIEENTVYSASFFPVKSWIYTVESAGFMRNQVRLMMGQLIELGKGNITLNQLEEMIQSPSDNTLKTIAQSSGLILHKMKIK